MSADLIEISTAKPTYAVSGRVTGYQVEVRHTGLNEYALLRAPEVSILQNKTNAKLALWRDKWSRIVAQKDVAEARFKSAASAEKRTHQAQDLLEELRNLLKKTVNAPDSADWSSLEDRRPFRFASTSDYPGLQFDESGVPQRPIPSVHPAATAKPLYPALPTFGILDRIFSSRREAKLAAHMVAMEAIDKQYGEDLAKWKTACEAVDAKNEESVSLFHSAQAAYGQAQQAFLTEQEAANEKVRGLHAKYLEGDQQAVAQNCELALAASRYPDIVKKEFTGNYSGDSRIAVIDYCLPCKSDIPTLSRVTFIQSRNEYKEAHISDAERNRLYDDVLYQIALRSLHEVFESDLVAAIDAVVFNGWVEDVNPATGRPVTGCLLSVQAKKDEFAGIELSNVDPKACFRQLKGVAASKLSGMTPIQPILQLERDDPRFISPYSVTDEVDSGINLAAMDWEDFEHLIREVFEKEFGKDGGEVKVTRASSDGGVDAIAFDPDPIRGGKIVIQAKRYSNTVGVSAVRDLYGTVMNEGANKGILVTTADYGPDAYDFAKGKPLTLLSGSNLLFLLSKHGHKARIDLKEAKLMLAGRPFGRQREGE
jgi:restriction system protein